MYAGISLYKYYDPWQVYDILFQKDMVAIRPFCIPTDFGLYNEWMRNAIDTSTTSPFYISKNYFITLAESTNAQPLWGLLNDEPAFQLDVYAALDYYPAGIFPGTVLFTGDIVIQLTIASYILKAPKMADGILPACLAYLFSFPQTGKIFWIIEDNNNDTLYRRIARNTCLNKKPYSKSGGLVYQFDHLHI